VSDGFWYSFAKLSCAVPLHLLWRLKVIGEENIPRDGAAIIAANHVSYFDPPAVGVASRRELHYMAKEELFSIPVLGFLISKANSFPVDRKRGDHAAIKRSLEILKKGEALMMFPEGTRNLDGTLRAQLGIALLVARSGAPVVPAYVSGTRNLRRFPQITVRFGTPLHFDTSKKASREELAKWAETIMQGIFALKEETSGAA